MGKYLETMKNITKDKNKEKIIYILLAAVVILIASSYIFNDSKDNNIVDEKENADQEVEYIYSTNYDLEEKLSSVISKVNGISEVSVFVTYKDSGTIIPLYNTVEKDGVITKEVIYEEKGSDKSVAIEKTLLPSVEGVIVVAKGVENVEIQSKIATAISSALNIGVYKVQVLVKGE